MLRAALTKIKSRFASAGSSWINPEDYNVVKEGKAEILFPKAETVFYNPVQEFNRDLSVCCIKAWDNLYGGQTKIGRKSKSNSRKRSNTGEDDGTCEKRRKLDDKSAKRNVPSYMRILEALSATGLRAIRYAHEIPHVKEIVANDLLPEAIESIKRNVH